MTRVNPTASSLSLSPPMAVRLPQTWEERERQKTARKGEQEALVLEDNPHWLWDCGGRSRTTTLAEASL